MEECVDLIMEELEERRIINSFTLAYQVLYNHLVRSSSDHGHNLLNF